MKLEKDISIDTLLAETKRYAETDMLCYRSPEDSLAAEQRRLWDPIAAWAEQRYDIRLVLTEGLMPVAQKRETLEVLHAEVDALRHPRVGQADLGDLAPLDSRHSRGFPLRQGFGGHAARNDEHIRNVAKLTKLLGSLIVALAVYHKAITIDQAIEASFLEETHQAGLWGEDEEAKAKREAKMAEVREAATLLG